MKILIIWDRGLFAYSYAAHGNTFFTIFDRPKKRNVSKIDNRSNRILYSIDNFSQTRIPSIHEIYRKNFVTHFPPRKRLILKFTIIGIDSFINVFTLFRNILFRVYFQQLECLKLNQFGNMSYFSTEMNMHIVRWLAK